MGSEALWRSQRPCADFTRARSIVGRLSYLYRWTVCNCNSESVERRASYISVPFL